MERDSVKKNKQKITSGRIKLFILLAVLTYVIVMLVNISGQIKEHEERAVQIEARKEALEHELSFLENEFDFIGSDEYIERQARQRLGWLKDGEIKYISGDSESAGILEDQTAPVEETPTDTTNTESSEGVAAPDQSELPAVSAPSQPGEQPLTPPVMVE